MSARRESFLQKVRDAVAEGNRAGTAPPLPERGGLGYQGAGPDAVARFRQELLAAGGNYHEAADAAAAGRLVNGLVGQFGARRILLGSGPVLDSLNLSAVLHAEGREICRVAAVAPEEAHEQFFAADLGITGVECLIAETGSLVMATRPQDPRSASLLPQMHIAVAQSSQLVPDLFDLFPLLERWSPGFSRAEPELQRGALPSCLTLITGPSKTGDIELRLVTGVHGPGEVHVVVINS